MRCWICLVDISRHNISQGKLSYHKSAYFSSLLVVKNGKFIVEFFSEIISKIGQYMMQLWQELGASLFEPPCIVQCVADDRRCHSQNGSRTTVGSNLLLRFSFLKRYKTAKQWLSIRANCVTLFLVITERTPRGVDSVYFHLLAHYFRLEHCRLRVSNRHSHYVFIFVF